MTPEEGKKLKPGMFVKLLFEPADYRVICISWYEDPSIVQPGVPAQINEFEWLPGEFYFTFVGYLCNYRAAWDKVVRDNECLLWER